VKKVIKLIAEKTELKGSAGKSIFALMKVQRTINANSSATKIKGVKYPQNFGQCK
jgi:hypothetical protein